VVGAVGNYGSHSQRVFVLVDQECVMGVFFTWEAAEAFGDENRLPLNRLMEYETRKDYPDHLHLMSAQWDDDWEFQGAWTTKAPDWPTPPKKVRLDHYHAKGNAFHMLRQREFDWEPDLLDLINPMAPDPTLRSATAARLPTDRPQWKPKLALLKPLTPIGKAGAPVSRDQEQTPASPSVDSTPTEDHPASFLPSERPKIAPPPPVEKPKLKLTPPAIPNTKNSSGRQDDLTLGKTPTISCSKKNPLRLKKVGGPTPIPAFQPTLAPSLEEITGKSSVELAQQDPTAMATKKPVEPEFTGKPKRVWAPKLIFSLAATAICWTAGGLWVLRPEPTAASVLAEVTTLNNARVIVIEPTMVFFQLDVDPVHQERWIQNLKMDPIPTETPVAIPTYHALDTWEKPNGFIRPPFGDVEVKDWWKLRLRDVRYGFSRTLDNGSILILDFESDTIIGWAQARQLPQVLN
jgi:hypothetical protein